jgi:hypothetical protein
MAYQWEELGLGDQLSDEYLCTLMADLYQPYLSSKTNHDMSYKPTNPNLQEIYRDGGCRKTNIPTQSMSST